MTNGGQSAARVADGAGSGSRSERGRVRAALIDRSDGSVTFGGAELLEAERGNAWLWLDLEHFDPVEEHALLEEKLGLDPLAITDAQRERHPPKLEFFATHLFLLLKGLDAESIDINFGTLQLAFFLGDDFLVTRRAGRSVSTERIWRELEHGELDVSRGPAHTLYRICRRIADRYTPIVLTLEERLDELEDEMFREPRDALLAELMNYNGNLKKLRRIFTYQQELMSELSSGNARFLDERGTHEFRDVFEQMERLASLCHLMQELAVDLMNGYLSLASHHLNQIMKVLTIVTVLFLPLGLLAGIYGMNFEHMPELGWRYSYFVALGVMGTILVTLLLAFRRRGWL